MKTPPARKAQLKFAERPVPRILQQVFASIRMRGSGAATNCTRICWLSMVYRGRAAQRTPPPPAQHSSAITKSNRA